MSKLFIFVLSMVLVSCSSNYTNCLFGTLDANDIIMNQIPKEEKNDSKDFISSRESDRDIDSSEQEESENENENESEKSEIDK